MTESENWAEPVLQNAFDLWFAPELDRRAAAGTIPPGFQVWGVQLIVDIEASAPVININDEIKGVLRARSTGPVEKGQQLTLSELGDIAGLELTQDHPNAGHFTAILHNGQWFIAFDFRRNATRIAVHVAAIHEFLGAGEIAVQNGWVRPAVENLFAAVELMAKSFIMMIPDRRVLNATSHGFVHSTFNAFGRSGLAPSEFVTLLNELTSIRPSVRYLRGALPSIELCADLLARATDMFGHLNSTRPTRFTEQDQSVGTPRMNTGHDG